MAAFVRGLCSVCGLDLNVIVPEMADFTYLRKLVVHLAGVGPSVNLTTLICFPTNARL